MRLLSGCQCSHNKVKEFGWTEVPDPKPQVAKMNVPSRVPSDGYQCGGSSVNGKARGGGGRGSLTSQLAEY